MSRKLIRYAFIALALIAIGYFVPWTGFGARWLPDGTYVEAKSFWDWLELVVIPFTVGFALYLVARQEQLRDKTRQQAQSMDASLEGYLDRMTNLLLDGKLPQSPPFSELRKVASSRTLTVLRSVDGARKGIVIRFLRDANLILASDPIINLTGADLKNADLRGAELNETNLTQADLQGADLSGALLASAELWRSNLRNAKLTSAECYGANFNSADFSGASLANASLETAHFSQANLSSCDLSKARLQGADLKDADIRGASLLGADLQSAHLMGIKSDEMTRLDPKWALVLSILQDGAEGRDLQSVDLSGARLFRARLPEANLHNADLSNTDLNGADLRKANLAGANLNRASLSRARLTNADLSKADLSHADLSFTDVSGANLETATLDWAKLRSTTADKSTRLTPKWQLVRDIQDRTTRQTNLRNADFSRADLSYADLSNADLLAANFEEAILDNVNLAGASLKYATMQSTLIDHANLRGADFREARVEAYSICSSTNDFAGAIMPDGHEVGRSEMLLAHQDWLSRTGQVEGMYPAGFGHALSNWIPSTLYPAEGEPLENYDLPPSLAGLGGLFSFSSGLRVAFNRFIVYSYEDLKQYATWFHAHMRPAIDADPADIDQFLLVLGFDSLTPIPETIERDYLQLFRLHTRPTRIVGVLYEGSYPLRELFRKDFEPTIFPP